MRISINKYFREIKSIFNNNNNNRKKHSDNSFTVSYRIKDFSDHNILYKTFIKYFYYLRDEIKEFEKDFFNVEEFEFDVEYVAYMGALLNINVNFVEHLDNNKHIRNTCSLNANILTNYSIKNIPVNVYDDKYNTDLASYLSEAIMDASFHNKDNSKAIVENNSNKLKFVPYLVIELEYKFITYDDFVSLNNDSDKSE